MHIAPLIVAFSLFDFMQLPPVPPVQPAVSFAEQGAGELTVAVGTQQSLGSVPRGASRIQFLSLNLSASCDADVTVESIVLTHVGQGSAADISAVYLSDGTRRIGRSQRFDPRRSEATLRLQGLTIPKCSAVRLSVLGDIALTANSASEHGINLAKSADIVSSAKKTLLQRTDDTERIIAAPKDAGSITVNFLPVPSRPRYGRIETVARLQISADAKSSHLLKRVTFSNRATARDSDLINFTIETRSGTVLTTVTQRMKASQVTLNFSPTYILHRSQTVVLLLKAEIHASQSRQINFYIEEPADLEATLYQER